MIGTDHDRFCLIRLIHYLSFFPHSAAYRLEKQVFPLKLPMAILFLSVIIVPAENLIIESQQSFFNRRHIQQAIPSGCFL